MNGQSDDVLIFALVLSTLFNANAKGKTVFFSLPLFSVYKT